MTHPVLIGTAGHIDHGKTALVKALTGIDTDRLKEEQRRGITIELGFAHLLLDDRQLGVVDVPGHERFIKSMVAGAGGIDLAMLVVAADEGVMPQTREHLDICGLLGVKRGLVALTKVDLVDADWLKLVSEDLRESLRGSFLAEAPIVPCSSVTGQGLDELRRTLGALARTVTARDPHGLLRLPLDRVFTMKGFGTVVTGTLLSGTLVVGENATVLPGGVEGKVRGLQVHGVPVERALAGQRTAVNLGGVDRQAVARGEVLVHPGTLHPSAMIDAEVQLLPSAGRPLPRRSRALFHLGTRQQEASCVLLEGERLEPGRSALAQLHFESPVVALPGDRFILRGFRKQENYGTTVGGGRVIRVLSQRVRPRDLHAVDLLRRMAVADAVNRVALEVLGAGPRGLSLSDLRRRLPLVPGDLDRALDRLRDQSLLVRYDKERGAVVHREHFQDLLGRCLALVDRFHREQPLEPGLRREELRSRLGVDLDPRLFFALLQSLEKNGELAVEHEICRRPGHTARAASPSLEDLVSRVRQIYEDAGLGPPWDASLAAELHADPSHVAGALRLLVDAGDLVRVAGLYFARGALEDLKQRLIAFLDREGQISAAQFKDLVRQSRKFSIPLAEHFDAQKVTLRVGDLRKRRG